MASTAPLTITDSAARRVRQLMDKQNNDHLKLRVSVSGGGCSGFQYGFALAESPADDDTVIEDKGVTLLIDSMSLLYLAGSEIDFFEDLAGSSFKVNNPNAASSCGCGTSFSI
ncbi:MAG: iron-sulfur cluster insertion protein ErpA [Sphingomonadales bacterium]|nr:iron-sulfur cluster insertion protein ErpA [Sphingomonadales bacterium]